MLAVIHLSVFAFAVQQSLVNPVLPVLREELGTTQSGIGWVVTAFLISASVSTPVLGRLGDRYGKERFLVVALVGLAIGTLISALAQTIEVMIVGRLVQGIGGGVLPLAFGIIRDEAPRERMVGAIGAAAALTAVGAGVGTVLAGPLNAAFGVRSLFWIPMALAVVATVAAHLVVPPSPSRRAGRISWLAAVLMAGWLVALLLPLAQGPTWGWSSGPVVGLLAASVVLAATWAGVERRSVSPLVDLRMMRLPAIWATNLVSLLSGVGLFAIIAFLPVFIQTPSASGYGFGVSVTQVGLLLLPMAVLMSLTGLASARLINRFGARAVLVAATLLNVAALALLAVAHQHLWQVVLASTVFGAAFGAASATMSTVINVAVDSGDTGVANGVNANLRTIGGAVGAALMGGILSASTGWGGLPTEGAFTVGFAALGVAGLLALPAALAVPQQVTRVRGDSGPRRRRQPIGGWQTQQGERHGRVADGR
ncbi:MFS transporter [Micromonospora chokoriensis]